MTPREKVALQPCPFCGGVNLAFTAPCPGGGIGVLCRTCHTNMDSRCESEDSAAEAWNRRTALASGSGDHSGGVTDMVDHAELARLAKEASSGPWSVDADDIGRTIVASPVEIVARDTRHNSAFIAAANPATVLALLAENAALRGEREGWGEHYDRATNLHASTCRDLAEAERKLAEAVGLLRRTTEALGWAWPKALMAMDDHRLLRMKAGHDDIVGQYRSGTSYVGIYQSEVDEIESNGDTLKEARTFLSKDAERG